MESLETDMQLSVRIWSRVLIGMVFSKAELHTGTQAYGPYGCK